MDPRLSVRFPAQSPAAGPPSLRPIFAARLFWGLAGIFLVLSYLPMIRATAEIILSSDDMAHGLFAPLVAAYLCWEMRALLSTPSDLPSYAGLPILIGAALLGVASTIAQSSTFGRLAFLISLGGCLVAWGGFRLLRRFLFPLALLLFTFPIPDVLYGQLTQPLQLLASFLAELSFESLGYGVIRDGNILQLAHIRLNVVEACSGLRSLVTLTFFCLIYGYFLESRAWLRVLVVLLAIPAAIFVNMLRIVSTGILGKYNVAWTKGLYHDMLGWSGFFVGFFLVFCAHRLIARAVPARVPA